jgi:hypothetical protein
MGTDCNVNLYHLVAITAPRAVGWRQVQAAATALEVFLPQPVATTRARREIEILYVGHSFALWNLHRKNFLIDIFCPRQVLGPNVDREKHTWRIGLLYTMRNSRFCQFVLQMMNPGHVSRSQYFERG